MKNNKFITMCITFKNTTTFTSNSINTNRIVVNIYV